MNNRDKEIRKMMTEKGFDSFDDLSERLNQFPITDSYEDVVAELAELKMQLINPQPLFTLTADRVEIVKKCIEYLLRNPPINAYGCVFQEENDLLGEINQWQDENNKRSSDVSM